MRRICLIALAAVLSVAACGPSSITPTPSPGIWGGGGGGGGGSGSSEATLAPGATATPGTSGSQGTTGGQVTITSGGVTVTLTDATCHHAVVGGVGITSVLAGSQESGDGKPDGISMNIPDDPSLNATISGSLGGRAFALGPDARGHVEGNSGTWSGTDILGSGAHFSGTFTCP
ncbi:MAG: hypothetical protein ABSB75_03410 [Candidatus Limnocylindrales bacterium]